MISTFQTPNRPIRAATALVLILGLSACENTLDVSRLGSFFGGGDRAQADAAAQPTFQRPNPDERGVITYNTYQVMVARERDSIGEMASRVGLSAQELAAHNGLPVTYNPRPGEVLALPRNVGGTPADNVWSPDMVSSAIDSAPLDDTANATTTGPNPFGNGQPGSVIDPIRHRVEPGDTAYSIARLYGVSVTALASWNGLGSDLAVRENQELLIPIINGANSTISTENTGTLPGEGTVVPAPPSASTPLPENQDVASIEVPEGPNLGALRTPPGGRLARPVAGSILRPFSISGGSARNEGVDISAAAGTPVTSAEAGEVALVSKSLGGLGTIVLIRHADDLMTVYGRVTDVSLEKGARVARGQTIGVVAPGDEPNLHFEVRRGTEAVDPMPYIGG